MLTIPNILTLLRLLLVPFFLMASFRGMYGQAFAIFVTAAVTDIFDGMIARRLNQRSRIGAILDPAVDKMMMVSGFIYYTFAELPLTGIPGWLTFVVFIRDFLIFCFAYLLYTRVRVKRFPPSIAGKASTVLQAVTLATTMAVNSFLPSFLPFAIFLFRLSLLATLFSGWGYLRQGERLLYEGLAEGEVGGKVG